MTYKMWSSRKTGSHTKELKIENQLESIIAQDYVYGVQNI